jgi:endonuclease/exonuclease/phosphatase family metal-dependent hydrolase
MMRVATWNADGGLGTSDSAKRKAEKTQYLRSLEANLICLPEYGRGDPDPSCFGQSVSFLCRTGMQKGLAITCDMGLLTEYRNDLEKAYLACYWQLDALELRVVAVHSLAHRYCGNMIDALADLRDWLRGGPSIVAGDFNANGVLKAGDNARKFRELWEKIKETGLTSAWHAARGRTCPGRDDPATLCTINPREGYQCTMIDYICISDHFSLEGCEVVPPTPSNHKAVIATLVPPPTAAPL